ncbi:MAG: RraA family protein [Pseudomonadota bacterium]
MSQPYIFERQQQASAALIARFRGLPVANISDVMMRLTAGGPRLRPMHGGGAMAGPAFTVKTRPGDNLLVHKALDLAQPGDIVVVDAGGDLTNAIIGELMSGYAASRGLGGLVINGAVRDADALRAASLPVYAAGVTHRGPYKDGPGQINVAVSLDGMVVRPGDVMVGDADGVLCIPLEDAQAVCEAALQKHAQEEQIIADIATGRLDTSWVDAALKRLGYLP